MTVGSEHDTIGQIERLESMVNAQARVLDLVGANAPLEKILQEIADLYQLQIEGSVASIMLANSDGATLNAGGAPNLDPAFCVAIDPVSIAEGSGTSGTAAFRREPVTTVDIETDPNWEIARSAAHAAGLRACWSVPIIGSDDRLLGVFAAYWRDPASPSAHDSWVQHQFARLTQVAIERAQTVDRVTHLLADERRRIAGDIHDDPIQAITAVGLRLQRVKATANPDQATLIDDALQAVNGAVDRLRHMVFELHPPSLDEDGLVAALEAYLGECFDDDGIVWNMNDDLETEPFHAVSSLAYRLTREAVANVVKHAAASNVEVSLGDADGGLRVRISDDGVGFEAPDSLRDEPGHMGLTNAHYLAHRAMGWWNISSSSDGTVVEFFLPTPSG